MASFTCQDCRCTIPITLPVMDVVHSVSNENTLSPTTIENDNRSSSNKTQNPDSIPFLDDSFVILPQNAKHFFDNTNLIDEMCPPFVNNTQSTISNIANDHTEGNCLPAASFHADLELAACILKLASDKCSVDFPLCIECSEKLFNKLQEEEDNIKLEINVYDKCLVELSITDTNFVSDSEFQAEIDAFIAAESEILSQLTELETKQKLLESEMSDLVNEEQSIKNLEDRYWKEYNMFQLDLRGFNEERDSLAQRTALCINNLKQLRRTNIFNDCFHIWCDGHFGTINSFRLGRLPGTPVEWTEINAAWGQTTLLLSCLVKKCKFEFSKYKIGPRGSFSYMQRLSDKQQFQLHNTNDFKIDKLFLTRNYDKGMLYFLECVNEFQLHIERQDSSFRCPYKIRDGCIGTMDANEKWKDYVPLKTQFTKDELWTMAAKHMLENLKFMIGWVAALP